MRTRAENGNIDICLLVRSRCMQGWNRQAASTPEFAVWPRSSVQGSVTTQRGGGGATWEGIQEGGDICISVADSCWCRNQYNIVKQTSCNTKLKKKNLSLVTQFRNEIEVFLYLWQWGRKEWKKAAEKVGHPKISNQRWCDDPIQKTENGKILYVCTLPSAFTWTFKISF